MSAKRKGGVINFDLTDFPSLDLKPCPFCGGTNDLELANTHTPCYWIRCGYCECELTGDSDYPDTVAGHRQSALNVINKWNRRV